VIDLPYREIWLVDFEFCQPPGERPEPACLVAMELRTGRKTRVWRDRFGPRPNPRSMGNFPIQGGCADLMRIAACLATERGIPVCAPVHDAFLVCSPVERIGADVVAMKEAMAEASWIALGGFELGTDAKVFEYPKRYFDKRGVVMWETINNILDAKYGRKIL
jgi:DNA polymerase I